MVRSVLLLLLGIVANAHAQNPDAVEFGRDVLPVLSTRCFACHGPDDEARQADLRLDRPADALAKRANGFAIVPGKPAQSQLLTRIRARGAERMPPEDSGKPPLRPDEVAILEKWVASGAVYTPHWAFQPRAKVTPPRVRDESWVRTPVDRFVKAQLERENVDPNPREGPGRLLRRVSLVLTGLPPDDGELRRFLADPSEAALDAAIDRRLTGPRYAEHWTRHWLDLARYADSSGYEKDNVRSIWRYKEWVLQAFSTGMRFDAFTMKQLAGDLLPGATDDDRIATAFHRNTLTNDEGGTDDEEFRVAAVVDRVNTTYEVWTGLTMACAQCHNHRYDPISQVDFYKSYAYFNQTADRDRPDESPVLRTEPLLNAVGWLGHGAKSESRPVWPETPVMRELPTKERRDTHVLIKGSFAAKGASVAPGTPSFLSSFPSADGDDRAALARWLLHPDHPLTARVIANRWFEKVMGTGLVDTPGNFGTQGVPPTNPELLDYLAQELVDSGWDLRHLLRLIVKSSTFAQSTAIPSVGAHRDPANRLLSRMSRVRLDAEEIRDAALAVSGLLHHRLGGPPVRPPQPDLGLSPYSALRWEGSSGSDRYRRGVYTFWRRSQPYASFATFDATPRDQCVSRRPRTNTPLQALALMNDPVMVEAAQALARRLCLEVNEPRARLIEGFLRVTGRTPDAPEVDTLLELANSVRIALASDRSSAEKVACLPLGPLPRDADVLEIASWTLVAQALLTMDEAITR